MTSTTPLAIPGLAGRTALLTAAGTPTGIAQALVLLASGARVLAVDTEPRLPALLVDAGTGLPGSLDYRGTGGGWSAVADWVGEEHAGLHGVILNGTPDAADALRPHLASDAALVAIGCQASLTGIRCNTVELNGEPTGPAAERVAAVVAFLVSEMSAAIDGVHMPLRP